MKETLLDSACAPAHVAILPDLMLSKASVAVVIPAALLPAGMAPITATTVDPARFT